MKKRGSVDWTVGKLLTIVLTVIVLVLVIYGLSTGTLSPLLEKMVARADEMLVLFAGLFGGSSNSGCYTESLATVHGGSELLESVGLNGDKESKYTICKGGRCEVNISGEVYSANDDRFKRRLIDFNDAFYHELYSGVDKLLEDAGLGDIYEKHSTGKFVLYDRDMVGADFIYLNKKYVVWMNGEWKFFENENEGFSIYDDDNALARFSKTAQKGIDNFIYYYEDSSDKDSLESFDRYPNEKYERIGELIGAGGNDNKIDSPEDLEILQNEFKRIKKRLTQGSYMLEGDIDDLLKAVDGKVLSTSRGDFKLGLLKEAELLNSIQLYRIENNIPMITISSGDEMYAIQHTSHFLEVSPGHDFAYSLDDSPLVLVNLKGGKWESIGNEEIYKLPDKSFEIVNNFGKINDFLKEKCP